MVRDDDEPRDGDGGFQAVGCLIGFVGLILFFGALATIVICRINLAADEYTMENNFWGTILSGGENLSKMSYTFTPPWSGFEVFVLVAGIVGAIILLALYFIAREME